MASFTDLKNAATVIRDELGVGKNSANRIGKILLDLMYYLDEEHSFLGEEIGKRALIEDIYAEVDKKAYLKDVYTRLETDNRLKYSADHIVTNPVGTFSYGDNLKDLAFETILYRMLCPNVSVKLPYIDSLSVDNSALLTTGRIRVTIHRSPGSGIPSHYALTEDLSAAEDWKVCDETTPNQFTFTHQFSLQGRKTIYVKLKNSAGESNMKSASVVYGNEILGKMYLGFLTEQDLSNASAVISGGYSSILAADILKSANVREYDLATKVLDSCSPPVGSILFFAVPDASDYKIMKDNGLGNHVGFTSASGSSVMEVNGEKTVLLNSVFFRMYGEDVNTEGIRTIYVEQK